MPPAASQANIRLPTMFLLTFTIVLAFVTTPANTAAASSQCYYAGGQPIKDGKTPVRQCEWNQGVADKMKGYNDGTCCGRGHGCLGSGLCIDPGSMAIYQGGCVTRNGDRCWQECGRNGKLQVLEKCGGKRKDAYVCPGNKDDCEDKDGKVIEVNDFVIFGTVTDERMTTQTSTKDESSSSSSSTSSSSSGTNTATNSLHPTTTTSGPAETVTETSPADNPKEPLPTDDKTSNDDGQTEEPNRDDDPSGIVPLAVGISIGGVALVAIVFGGCWWHRDKVRREPARAETPPQTTGPIADSREFIYLSERGEGYGRMRGF